MKLTSAILVLSVATVKAQPNFFWSGKGTPDGLTAGANGFFSICDGFEGDAKAKCSIYCYAQDCYLEEESSISCENALAAFEAATTGEVPPCVDECPCFSEADLIADNDNLCQVFPDGSYIVTNNANPFESTGTVFLVAEVISGDNSLCFKGDIGFPEVAGAVTATQAEACIDRIINNFDCTEGEFPF